MCVSPLVQNDVTRSEDNGVHPPSVRPHAQLSSEWHTLTPAELATRSRLVSIYTYAFKLLTELRFRFSPSMLFMEHCCSNKIHGPAGRCSTSGSYSTASWRVRRCRCRHEDLSPRCTRLTSTAQVCRCWRECVCFQWRYFLCCARPVASLARLRWHSNARWSHRDTRKQ